MFGLRQQVGGDERGIGDRADPAFDARIGDRVSAVSGPGRTRYDAGWTLPVVDAEDASVRANRYALLAQLRGLFLGVADISLLG